MPAVTITVNGTRREVQAPGDTPLLYVLRNELELSGPQFGCGLSQCGACSVLVDGKESRSCVLPLSRVSGKEITTLEGLPERWAKQRSLPASEA
jgi:isoquinoline 1-oxidoreductase alpha subunit